MAECWVCGAKDDERHDVKKHGGAWCSPHNCEPHDCFRIHNPKAYRDPERDGWMASDHPDRERMRP